MLDVTTEENWIKGAEDLSLFLTSVCESMIISKQEVLSFQKFRAFFLICEVQLISTRRLCGSWLVSLTHMKFTCGKLTLLHVFCILAGKPGCVYWLRQRGTVKPPPSLGFSHGWLLHHDNRSKWLSPESRDRVHRSSQDGGHHNLVSTGQAWGVVESWGHDGL